MRQAFALLADSDVSLDDLHIWRPAATYGADRPEARCQEDSLRAHATVALDIAALAADRCRDQGISESALVRYGRRCDRCRTVLDGPIRHDAPPGHPNGR